LKEIKKRKTENRGEDRINLPLQTNGGQAKRTVGRQDKR
jgi:hypothetical protein